MKKMGQGTKKNLQKMKNIYNKKKQAWYHNSKEPDKGPAWQNFKNNI